MSLRGSLQGSILSRGVASGAGVDIPAPDNLDPPVISSFTIADNPIDEDVETTFSWTLGGDAPTSQIVNPGDGSANYTVSPGTTSVAHTYADADTYVATLGVSNSAGSDSDTIPDIVVSAADASFFPAADNTVEYVAGTWTDIESTHTNWGSTASNLPIKGRYKLDPGALDPATHQIYAEIGGVEYPCQISERTTYDWDDTLQFFTWHVLYSASWTSGATVKVTLKKRTTALHAETDSRATSLITGAYTPKVTLTEVKKAVDQSTYGSGTFEATLADAAARTGQLVKTAAGPIYSEWQSWSYYKDGGSPDAYLRCLWVFGAYCDSGTDTIRYAFAEPRTIQGWPNAPGPGLVYKAALYDGASLLRDFTGSFTRTTGEINTASDIIAAPAIGADKFPTGAVVFSGDVPGGLSGGTIYTARHFTAGASYVSRNGVNIYDLGAQGSVIQLTANGGGSFTMETRIHHAPRSGWVARQANGWPIGLTGNIKIGTTLTRAEKIDRFNHAVLRPVDLDGAVNEQLDPAWNYYPGSLSFHRSGGDDQGDDWAIGETGNMAWNVMLDTTNEDYHDVLMKAAAEYHYYGEHDWWEDETNSGTGDKYGTLMVLTNGPGGAGTKFTGMGQSRGNAVVYIPGAANYGVSARSAHSGESNASTSPGFYGTKDGSHPCAALHWALELYGHSQDLIGLMGEFTKNASSLYTAGNIGYAALSPKRGIEREFNSRTYVRCFMPALMQNQNNGPRIFAGICRSMIAMMEVGSMRTEYGYARAFCEEQFEWLEEALTNTGIYDEAGKMMGLSVQVEAGNQQDWQIGRVIACHIDFLRKYGKHSKNMVRFLGAFFRGQFGDAVDGKNRREYLPGAMAGSTIGSAYWPGSRPQSYYGNVYAPECKGFAMLKVSPQNDAMDNWRTSVAVGTDKNWVWNTNGTTITVTEAPSKQPPFVEGDMIYLDHRTTLPTGIAYESVYFVYDKSGNDWKISSTDPLAGPPTQVTWTAASPVASGTYDGNSALGVGNNATTGLPNAGCAPDYFGSAMLPGPLLAHYYGLTYSEIETALDNAEAVKAMWRDHHSGFLSGGAMELGLYGKAYCKYQPT